MWPSGCGGLGHIRHFCRSEKRSGDNMEPAHKAKIAEGFKGDGVFAAFRSMLLFAIV